ncbi:hypothetical protein BDV32DRAFT_129926 [Aspergillus pseudonomiae]|uniref:Uncharacterized protein n=1 Tax=Aspergillus pseudonomiae TaxID=1506151 RepID=A0A5N7DFX3_9EURO|nr:uncharacterized protein BDV37DRAFT_95492 [Aspergillus pseudonomiae]KAB8255934.1 hypothetical protein BDV32DRAFT_129926 [Aspergillus pseudonomiae]KAE8405310.1 hypothetical protein BDV37DRAFT_95492 [Aspergillus pseudonomiae]
MSMFNILCGCVTRSSPLSSQPPAQPRHQPQNGDNGTATYNPDSNGPPGMYEDDGYSPVVPLPRYTPRPVSIQEKTLEAHMRDPPVSSSENASNSTYFQDEKDRLAFEMAPNRNHNPEDLTSEVSSAISFPSSYGNTSTATRDTPPPPYSSRGVSPAPSRSMSVSSSGYPLPPQQVAMMQIAQPRPVFQRPHGLVRNVLSRRSFDEEHESGRPRRFSWENQ